MVTLHFYCAIAASSPCIVAACVRRDALDPLGDGAEGVLPADVVHGHHHGRVRPTLGQQVAVDLLLGMPSTYDVRKMPVSRIFSYYSDARVRECIDPPSLFCI